MNDLLDPRQIIRIESVHRGFLYQHLYTGDACHLQAAMAFKRFKNNVFLHDRNAPSFIP